RDDGARVVRHERACRFLDAAKERGPVRRQRATVELVDQVEGTVRRAEGVAVDLETIAGRAEGQGEGRWRQDRGQGEPCTGQPQAPRRWTLDRRLCTREHADASKQAHVRPLFWMKRALRSARPRQYPGRRQTVKENL